MSCMKLTIRLESTSEIFNYIKTHLPIMFSGFFNGTQLTVDEQASFLVMGLPKVSSSMLS